MFMYSYFVIKNTKNAFHFMIFLAGMHYGDVLAETSRRRGCSGFLSLPFPWIGGPLTPAYLTRAYSCLSVPTAPGRITPLPAPKNSYATLTRREKGAWHLHATARWQDVSGGFLYLRLFYQRCIRLFSPGQWRHNTRKTSPGALYYQAWIPFIKK